MQPKNSQFIDSGAANSGSASLSVVTVRRGELAILAVTGSMDILTAPELEEAVADVLTGQPRGLIIDLTAAEFLSSAGMSVLVTAHESIAPFGSFGVVADGPSTARPLRLVGLDQTLTIYPTIDAAIAAMSGPENP
ncbi:STAS domain-containing protein [Williamsia sp.]|uniref:STAS domain-containing protein n=1 Tax=Williamsia sp. TaxID=1872085 RepID=UPI002F9535CE